MEILVLKAGDHGGHGGENPEEEKGQVRSVRQNLNLKMRDRRTSRGNLRRRKLYCIGGKGQRTKLHYQDERS